MGGCQVNGFCKRDATNNFLSPRYFNLFNLFVSRALPPLPQGWQKTILFHFFVNPSLINIGSNCESKAVKPGQTQSLVFATYKKSISCLVLCCVVCSSSAPSSSSQISASLRCFFFLSHLRPQQMLTTITTRKMTRAMIDSHILG